MLLWHHWLALGLGAFLLLAWSALSLPAMLCELLVSDILIRFCERIPYAFVGLHAMDHAGVSAQHYGWLVTVERVTAMLCYLPVAHLADKYGQRPFVFVTFIFFTLFPVSLLWADSFGWRVVAFAVRGLKEFGEPARKRSSSRRPRPTSAPAPTAPTT